MWKRSAHHEECHQSKETFTLLSLLKSKKLFLLQGWVGISNLRPSAPISINRQSLLLSLLSLHIAIILYQPRILQRKRRPSSPSLRFRLRNFSKTKNLSNIHPLDIISWPLRSLQLTYSAALLNVTKKKRKQKTALQACLREIAKNKAVRVTSPISSEEERSNKIMLQ